MGWSEKIRIFKILEEAPMTKDELVNYYNSRYFITISRGSVGNYLKSSVYYLDEKTGKYHVKDKSLHPSYYRCVNCNESITRYSLTHHCRKCVARAK